MTSIPLAHRGLCRNFDPTPPPCRISFDKDGHAIALTDLERSGQPAPAPTPMYAGVTANTPRVSVSSFSKARAHFGLSRISCPIARTLTRKGRKSPQLIKPFISINNSTLPPIPTTSDSTEWSLGFAIHPRTMLQVKDGWWSGLSL